MLARVMRADRLVSYVGKQHKLAQCAAALGVIRMESSTMCPNEPAGPMGSVNDYRY